MFATPQYMDLTAESGRKRLRDDEDPTIGSTGFAEHRTKRLQSLPLRGSPKQSQQSLSTPVVPLNASPSHPAAGLQSELSHWPSTTSDHGLLQGHAEVDMMDSVESAHGATHTSTQHHDALSGRMPTPIQPSFAAQVRGQTNGWAPPNCSAAGPNGVVNLGHHVTGLSHDQSVPRGMSGEVDWQVLQNNRRLPSPISEVGDSGCHGHDEQGNGMMLDGDDHTSQSQLSAQFEQSSLSGQPSPTDAMHHPNTMICADAHPQCQPGDVEGDPSSPSPGRRGHVRSKHTVNSWTWQPGMKKSFSIGYRSDCEKCRLKVPGHFNHIVIS